MTKSFTYVVTIIAQYGVDGSIITLPVDFTGSVEIDDNSYYVPFPIDPKSINDKLQLALVEYAQDNGMDVGDIEVITKEVMSNDSDVDIYFEERESDNIIDVNPDIKVEITPSVYKPETPKNFIGYFDGSAISWQWSIVKGCAYKMYDESNNIVATTGMGNRYFIQDDIEPGKTYTRRVVAYNADGDSEPSDYVTVDVPTADVEEDIKSSIMSNQNGALKYKTEINEVTKTTSRLKKFKSGVGDGKDLNVFKPDQSDIHEVFTVNAIVEANNTVEQRVYTPIDVEFYIKATGNKVIHGDTVSGYKLRMVPWPIQSATLSVHSVISEPLSFDVEYRLETYYQKLRSRLVTIEVAGYDEFPRELPVGSKVHITARDENGDIPDADVIFTTSTNAMIDDNGDLTVLQAGEVTINAFYKFYNATYTRKAIASASAEALTYVEDIYKNCNKYTKSITSGYRVAKKMIPYKKRFTINGVTNNLELENIEQYLRNCDNDLLSSPARTVEVVSSNLVYCSNQDVYTSIVSNTICVTSIQNERIYVYRKTIKAKVDQKNGIVIVDPNSIVYRNKYNAAYSGNSLPYTTIDYVTIPANIEIYDEDGNIRPATISGKVPKLNAIIKEPADDITVDGGTTASTPKISYKVKDLFPALLASDINEYLIEVVELKINGTVKYESTYGPTSIIDGVKYLRVTDVKSDEVCVTGDSVKSIQPFEQSSDTFKCTVNGATPYVYDYDGKKSYVDYAPIFKFPFDTENVEYEVVVFNKAMKRIDAEFENGHKYRGTRRNGDLLTISSTDYETIKVYKKQEIANTTTGEIILDSVLAHDIEVDVYNPAFNKASDGADLAKCFVTLVSTNPNVTLKPSNMTIDFTDPAIVDEIKTTVTVSAKITSANQTAWSPNIMAGHYYINSDEYYLYEETDIKGEFCKETKPVVKEFFASVIANIETKGNSLPITRLLSGKTSFSNGTFKNTVYEDGKITLDYYSKGTSKIYYDNGEYYTEEIVLGNELDNISVSYDGKYLDDTKCFVSLFDGVDWSAWTEVGIGYKLKSDTYIRKFKIKFELSRLVDKAADYTESVTTSTRYELTKQGYSSNNVHIEDQLITQKDIKAEGYYISPVKEVVSGSTYVNIIPKSLSVMNCDVYIAFGNTTTFTPVWSKLLDKVSVEGHLYYRYKIVFKPGSKIAINSIDTVTHYTNTSQVSVSPEITSIETSSIPDEWIFAGTIKKPLFCKLKANAEWQYITKHNILDIIYPDIALAGIAEPRIQDVLVELKDADIEVEYDYKKDSRIKARTKTVETEEVNSKYLLVNSDHEAFVSPIPKLGAPVILTYDGISLEQITEYDIDGNASNLIEDVAIVNDNMIILPYNDIDPHTLSVVLGEEFVKVSKVINNKVILGEDIDNGTEVEVIYKVKYSFSIDTEYDIENDIAKLIIHLDSELDHAEYNKVQVYYETGNKGYKRLYDIELNPLYIASHTGFVYLSDEKYEPSKVAIYFDKKEYRSTVVEDTSFIIVVTDELGNPVSDVPVRISTQYGRIKLKNNITNKYGIVSAKYIHPAYQCTDTITASVSDSDVKASELISTVGTSKTMILSATVKDSKFIVQNGETITIEACLFEEDLSMLKDKEIVVEVINESGVVSTSNKLTDYKGSATFDVVPIVSATDRCTIRVSYLNIEKIIYVKVV